jgi:hypothetical protein
MEGTQPARSQEAKVSKPPNPIKHFHLDYDLPKWTTIRPFERTHAKGAKKPKNKHKLTRFSYYRLEGKLMKVLYLNDQLVVEQGFFPFTDPSGTLQPNAGQIRNIKELEGELSRVIYVEMVYIGHYEETKEGQTTTTLVLKKMAEAKIDSQTSELETINDNFEVIPVGSSSST